MSYTSSQLLEFLDRVRATSTLEEAWDIYMAEIAKYGATHAGYGVVTPGPSDDSPARVIRYFDYREDFLQRYDEAGHFLNDSSIHHCLLRKPEPLVSTDPAFLASLSAGQLRVAQESFDFGIRHFVTFTLGEGADHGGVNISFGHSSEREFHDLLRAHLDTLRLTSILFHNAIRARPFLGERLMLSAREKECLRWVGAGLESKAIAHRIGISTRTVEHHVANAIDKLGANSRAHAVAKALILNLIEL